MILRKFDINDAEPMFRNWASDRNVTKYLTWQPYKDVDGVREYIKSVINRYDGMVFDWMIEFKESGEPIGTIGAVKYDEKLNSAHIGYCIGEAYWHKGITTEAFKRVIKYLFEEVGVNRIESSHDTDNPNSGKVMKKCGLLYEGTHRRAGINNQGIIDVAYYAMLKDEYLRR